MKKLFFIPALLLLAGCHAYVGGDGSRDYITIRINVSSNSSDSCHCSYNKFQYDSTFGSHCASVDSVKVSYDRYGKQVEAYTDSSGFTDKIAFYRQPERYYMVKQGYPGAYIDINPMPKAKKFLQFAGCDAHYVQLPNKTYYIMVILRPKAVHGVRLVPYKKMNSEK